MTEHDQRIGTAHRAHILDLLSRALGEGYLTLEEYELRTVAVVNAKVISEILSQFHDLPPQFKWEPGMPLPEDIEKARARSATNTARTALLLGALSIPLGFCIVGVPVGVAAIAVSFTVRGVPMIGWRNMKLARALGAGGIAIGVIFFVIALLTQDDTSTAANKETTKIAATAESTHVVPESKRTDTTPSSPSATTPSLSVTESQSTNATEAQATSEARPTSSKIVVPNGIGMNYQQAQDIWRGAGLVVAPAIDATGAHRLPMIDANWVVLSQDLAAGTTVNPGSTITATVKKYTDK